MMFKQNLICFSLCMLASIAYSQTDDPIREIEEGLVRGVNYHFRERRFIDIDKYLDIFHGIPFAEPPVGQLRFQKPVPKAKWDGVLNATDRSAACFQENPATLYLRKSEDCLYLSIYAPSPKPSGAAVMVFFHGGGFSFGSAMQFEYDGAPLSAVGDIIYVAVNYRLNVFGYMSTGDEAAPGNYGMFDQVEALKWVQRNIAAFGGDPNRVTIFGESAGAASSSFHLLSRGSRDLYSQVILESGASTSDWAFIEPDKAHKQSLIIGKECGCDTSNLMEMVQCLRTADAQAVFDASVLSGLFGGATIDGEFLEDYPITYLEKGDFKNCNIMLGTNEDEGAIYALGVYPEFILADDPPHMNKTDFLREVPRFMTEENPVFLDAMYQQYSPWEQADYPNPDYLRSFIEINTDPTFVCPTDQVARAHALAGDNVYLYQMTRDPSASLLSVGPIGPGWCGAAHSEELQFVFGSPFMDRNLHGELNDDDKALAVEFMRYWTNFAKTGNPNNQEDGLVEWPLFAVPEMEYLKLDLNMTVGRALKSQPCAFWNDYMVKLRSFAGDLPEVEREWRDEFYSWKHVDMVQWRDEFEEYKQVTGQCDKDGCK